MKLFVVLCLGLVCLQLHSVVSQQANRRKEGAETRVRSGGKRQKQRQPKVKEGVKGHSLLTQVLEKGRFLRLGPNTSLTPGTALELRCKGAHLGWTYPPHLDRYNDSRLSVHQGDKFSQLVLRSPSAADTGLYGCWTTRKDPETTHSSYIYFTDRENLFVPSPLHIQMVFLRADRPALVPCRVTDPQAVVSLHREVPALQLPNDPALLTFDPTQGFLLHRPTPQHQGVLYCRAEAGGTSQISNKYQLLYVEVPSGQSPVVSLQTSSASVRAGESFNVSCTVLGEPEEEVTFTWSYPAQGHRLVREETRWRLVTRGLSFTTRMSSSVLSLDDMETTDYGDYVCTARNQQGATSVRSTVRPL